MSKPTWQQAYDSLIPDPSKMDSKAEKKAVDVMLEERHKETTFSKKSREWEKDRKKEWNRNVPAMRKKDMEKGQAPNPYKLTLDEIKDGGKFSVNVKPLGGYILSVLEKPERKTQSGIILPDISDEEPNTARVIKVGKGYYAESGVWIDTEVIQGQLVLFRKFAGMNIEIKNIKYLMLHFSDIIAVLED